MRTINKWENKEMHIVDTNEKDIFIETLGDNGILKTLIQDLECDFYKSDEEDKLLKWLKEGMKLNEFLSFWNHRWQSNFIIFEDKETAQKYLETI